VCHQLHAQTYLTPLQEKLPAPNELDVGLESRALWDGLEREKSLFSLPGIEPGHFVLSSHSLVSVTTFEKIKCIMFFWLIKHKIMRVLLEDLWLHALIHPTLNISGPVELIASHFVQKCVLTPTGQ
jgi:hypothetical protein